MDTGHEMLVAGCGSLASSCRLARSTGTACHAQKNTEVQNGTPKQKNWFRKSGPLQGTTSVVFQMVPKKIQPDVRQGRILVLHGFIKKTQKTPPDDLALARRRNREFEK